jgi:thiamine pyrophosphokinase
LAVSRVLGVLGGRDLSPGQLRPWADSADALYAADSGAHVLLEFGHRPVVVGDMDSATDLPDGLRVVEDCDPDRTDCDKLLALVAEDGHRAVTLGGIEGDLFDHVLASLSSAAAARVDVRLVLRRGLGWVLRDGDRVRWEDGFGRRVSLIPIRESHGVDLSGVLWPISEARLEPGGFLSVSNEGTGVVEASLRHGAALLFVERAPDEPPVW